MISLVVNLRLVTYNISNYSLFVVTCDKSSTLDMKRNFQRKHYYCKDIKIYFIKISYVKYDLALFLYPKQN